MTKFQNQTIFKDGLTLDDVLGKLPPYVYEDKNRDGSVRYRFRRKGYKSVTIKQNPKSQEFREIYAELMRDNVKFIGEKYTLEWLINKYLYYLKSQVKASYAAESTFKQRKYLLNRLIKDYGNRSAFEITPKAIRFIVGQMATTPGAANNMLKSIKALYSWTMSTGMMDENPAADIKKIKYKTKGFISWKMSELRQFIHEYPLGTQQYLAAMLALCTGARRGDLCNLGQKNITNINGIKCIEYNSEKTSKPITVPILPELQEAIDAIEIINPNTFLPTIKGKARTKESLGTWFGVSAKKAGLKNRTLHGLRKAQGNLLAEMGLSEYEIMAIMGHASPSASEIYTKNANRIGMSLSGMAKVVNLDI